MYMSEIPEFEPDIPKFERDLVTQFYTFHEARVPIRNEQPDDTFASSTERISKRVLEIMKRYKLYDLADKNEQVISNVKYFDDDGWDGWMYSVRMQQRED